MNKRNICFLLILILAFAICCSACKATSVYEYRTTGDDIVSNLYLVKTEYYSNKVVIYWDGTISSLDDWGFSDDFIVDGKKLILKTEDPTAFNSFSIYNEDNSYSFRYLDSDQYACLYTSIDSEGGMDFRGSIDRYYTEEEIEKQNENALQTQAKQNEIFEKLEGTWICEDGDFIRIYKEDDYTLEYSVDDRQEKETLVYFRDNIYAKEDNMGVFYNDGPFENGFTVVLAKDGKSFEYNDKTFIRE